MFKNLTAFAVTAYSAVAVDVLAESESVLDLAQCNSLLVDGMYYNVEALYRESGPYSQTVQGSSQTLEFQYCATLADGDYGRVVQSNTIVADEGLLLASEVNLRDSNEEINGLQITQESDTECIAATEDDDAVNWSMITKITCDESITEAGNPTIESVVLDSAACTYTISMKHDAGCSVGGVDIEATMGWLYENEWAIGIIYLVAGPLIALFGSSWFPYVVAAIVAIFVIGLVCSISLAAGWMATGLGTAIVFIVALILGILGGMFIRRKVNIAISVLGAVGGFFSGSIVFALIASFCEWEAAWGFWIISVSMAIVGFLVSCKFGKGIVILSTALIGSYLFMRSWTLFFPGHWPSEAQLMDPANLELDSTFWIFFSIFAVGFIGSAFYQKNYQKEHEDLDGYERA